MATTEATADRSATTSGDATTALDLEPIKARHEAALAGPWRWFGRTDGEVYLATPDRGRIFVLNTDTEQLTCEDCCQATCCGMCEQHDCDQCEPCVDGHGARAVVRFNSDGWMRDARELARQEVDYRTDIAAIEHPDAEFIAHARADVPALIDEVERLRALLAEAGIGA